MHGWLAAVIGCCKEEVPLISRRVFFRVVTSQRSMRCRRLSLLFVLGRGGGTFWHSALRRPPRLAVTVSGRRRGDDRRFCVTLVRCVFVTPTISSSRLKVAVYYIITLLTEYRHAAFLSGNPYDRDLIMPSFSEAFR